MQTRTGRAALAKAEGEEAWPSLAETAPELMRAICQGMITGLRGALRAEINLVREDVNDLRTKTTKAFDHVAAGLANVENSMTLAVTAEDVAQLRKDLKLLAEGRNALSNEMDLRFPELRTAWRQLNRILFQTTSQHQQPTVPRNVTSRSKNEISVEYRLGPLG